MKYNKKNGRLTIELGKRDDQVNIFCAFLAVLFLGGGQFLGVLIVLGAWKLYYMNKEKKINFSALKEKLT